jgi:hypothetical protein
LKRGFACADGAAAPVTIAEVMRVPTVKPDISQLSEKVRIGLTLSPHSRLNKLDGQLRIIKEEGSTNFLGESLMSIARYDGHGDTH